jgi:hypothetical protein
VLGAVVGMDAASPTDRRRADALEDRACDLGVPTACLILGRQALEEKTPSRAAAYLEKACWISAGDACGLLGSLYERGLGVNQSESRALELYQTGCRRGDAVSCLAIVERGEPLPLPPDKQQLIYRGACGRGSQKACRKLQRR